MNDVYDCLLKSRSLDEARLERTSSLINESISRESSRRFEHFLEGEVVFHFSQTGEEERPELRSVQRNATA